MSTSESLGTVNEVTLPQGTVRYRERGTGQPLVFVHGLLVNGDLWRKVVPELSKDFRCITPDWPLGSHELPLRADADLSPPGVAKIVADFIAALDLEDVTLIGNDTGGAICQLVVAEHPDRIGRLVLTSCDALDVFPPAMVGYLPIAARVPGGIWLLTQSLRFRLCGARPSRTGGPRSGSRRGRSATATSAPSYRAPASGTTSRDSSKPPRVNRRLRRRRSCAASTAPR